VQSARIALDKLYLGILRNCLATVRSRLRWTGTKYTGDKHRGERIPIRAKGATQYGDGMINGRSGYGVIRRRFLRTAESGWRSVQRFRLWNALRFRLGKVLRLRGRSIVPLGSGVIRRRFLRTAESGWWSVQRFRLWNALRFRLGKSSVCEGEVSFRFGALRALKQSHRSLLISMARQRATSSIVAPREMIGLPIKSRMVAPIAALAGLDVVEPITRNKRATVSLLTRSPHFIRFDGDQGAAPVRPKQGRGIFAGARLGRNPMERFTITVHPKLRHGLTACCLCLIGRSRP
jgi:hypothetical protein